MGLFEKSLNSRDLQLKILLLQGWRIEMEDAHSAIIGIPDQKETGSLKEQLANFVTN